MKCFDLPCCDKENGRCWCISVWLLMRKRTGEIFVHWLMGWALKFLASIKRFLWAGGLLWKHFQKKVKRKRKEVLFQRKKMKHLFIMALDSNSKGGEVKKMAQEMLRSCSNCALSVFDWNWLRHNCAQFNGLAIDRPISMAKDCDEFRIGRFKNCSSYPRMAIVWPRSLGILDKLWKKGEFMNNNFQWELDYI